MIEKIKSVVGFFEEIPTNLYACFLVASGSIMVLFKHDDPGKGLIMTGLGIFKNGKGETK